MLRHGAVRVVDVYLARLGTSLRNCTM